MRLFATLGLSSILLAAPAFAAPIGVDFTTTTPEALGCKAQQMAGRYTCRTEPDQSGSSTEYELRYSATRGICMISGIGPVVKSGQDGAAVKEMMGAFKDQLMQTYGEPELQDGGFDGSPLADGGNWLAQVNAAERLYMYSWDFEPPRDGIDAITLVAIATGADEGTYHLQMTAADVANCYISQ